MSESLLDRFRRTVELQRRARNSTAQQAVRVWRHVPWAYRILFGIVSILGFLTLCLYLMGMFFIVRNRVFF